MPVAPRQRLGRVGDHQPLDSGPRADEPAQPSLKAPRDQDPWEGPGDVVEPLGEAFGDLVVEKGRPISEPGAARPPAAHRRTVEHFDGTGHPGVIASGRGRLNRVDDPNATPGVIG